MRPSTAVLIDGVAVAAARSLTQAITSGRLIQMARYSGSNSTSFLLRIRITFVLISQPAWPVSTRAGGTVFPARTHTMSSALSR